MKKAENFWKGLSHNRTQISPIPPQSYGERFINFITGITKSKEEAERQKLEEEQQQQQAQTSIDGTATAPQPRRSSVERAMDKAEKQAAKSEKTLAKDPEPPERVLTTVSAGPEGAGPSTLPVVEEVGEAGSTGSKSGGSHSAQPGSSSQPARDGLVNGEARPNEFRTAIAPSGPPPSEPPPPPVPNFAMPLGNHNRIRSSSSKESARRHDDRNRQPLGSSSSQSPPPPSSSPPPPFLSNHAVR